eukprot:gene4993-8591_t
MQIQKKSSKSKFKSIFGEEPGERSFQFLCQLTKWMLQNQVLETKDIFRETGNHAKINDYKRTVEFDQLYLQDTELIQDVAGLFTRYYHELPISMIKLDEVDEYCTVIELEENKKDCIQKIGEKLKESHQSYAYLCFGILFFLLHDIQLHSKKTLMTGESLSIIFVPLIIQQKKSKNPKDFLKHLLKGKALLKLLIENYPKIFDTDLMDAQYHKYTAMIKESPSNSENMSSSSIKSNSLLGFFKKNSLSRQPSSQEISSTSTSTSQNILYLKFNTKTIKYETVWNQKLFILKFDGKQFESFLFDIICYLNQEKIIQNRSYHLKTYENCFVASETVDIIYAWVIKRDEAYAHLTKEDIIYFMIFLSDINGIEHVADRDKKFTYEYLFFRFTEPVIGSKLTDQDYLNSMKENFIQFKIVNEFVKNSENVKDFYDIAFSSDDGLDIRNRTYHLKNYKSVFLGNEAVSWIRKQYENLGLTRYGATILGECFRQLHAFDHTCGDHPLRDEYLFYRMREEEEFLVEILTKYEDVDNLF